MSFIYLQEERVVLEPLPLSLVLSITPTSPWPKTASSLCHQGQVSKFFSYLSWCRQTLRPWKMCARWPGYKGPQESKKYSIIVSNSEMLVYLILESALSYLISLPQNWNLEERPYFLTQFFLFKEDFPLSSNPRNTNHLILCFYFGLFVSFRFHIY